jgi:hypothetical protein
MPLPQTPLDDPRVLALAKARQQLAHDGALAPAWEELTDKEGRALFPMPGHHSAPELQAKSRARLPRHPRPLRRPRRRRRRIREDDPADRRR